jgi:ribosome-binding factor A
MSVKQERMADRIREILSGLLLLEVTDPALQGLTVTDVTLDPELEYAEVYVNALGDETRQSEVMAGLKRASGFLRREVGRRIHIRRVPVLRFHWDISLSRAEAIEQLLDTLDVPPAPPEENPQANPEQNPQENKADGGENVDGVE